MKAHTKFDFNKISANKGFNVRLMLTLESKAKKSSKKNKKPLNISLVLDRSGSMAGDKIRNVKEAAKLFAKNLSAEDILSLTIFDDQIDQLLPPTKIKDVVGLENAIDRIRSRATTFLSGAYEAGCQSISQNKSEDNISRVFLLTDGLANRGETDPEKLAQLADRMRSDGITTSTVGVGNVYDEILLGKMAENGGGGTYFIENPEDAESVFSEELGYLKSLAATGLEVMFKAKVDGIKYEQINTYKVNPDGAFLLGDVYEGHKKTIVLELSLPLLKKGTKIELGSMDISYVEADSRDKKKKTLTVPVNIDAVTAAEFKKVKPDSEVTLEAALLTVAIARRKAMELADQRQFEKAAELLENYANALKKLNLKNDRLDIQIETLLERARELRHRKEDYYTPLERKRMFHESDTISKSKMHSYDSMMSRRQRGDRQYPGSPSRDMCFACYEENGHIFAEIDNDRLLVATGSPISFGENGLPGSLENICRKEGLPYPARGLFNNKVIGDLSRLIGTRISGILGMDILGRFDFCIDTNQGMLQLSIDEIHSTGSRVPFRMISGVPTIEIDIEDSSAKMIVSTETKLSFLNSRILGDRERVATDTDYFFGFGEFNTDVYRLTCDFGRGVMSLNFGRLPDTLTEMISVAMNTSDISGILGATFFDEFDRMIFSRRQNTMVFRKK